MMTVLRLLLLWSSIGLHILSSCYNLTAAIGIHTSNPALSAMMAQRCNAFDSNYSNALQRRITFTHIPKSGGSSVANFLALVAQNRSHINPAHEHFYFSANSEPNSTFVTLLREPISKAISMYAYISSQRAWNDLMKTDVLWKGAISLGPKEWSADKEVQRFLAADPTGLFLPDMANPRKSHAVSAADYIRIQATPAPKLKERISGTLQAFLSYTAELPIEYQCTKHMEVAFILLKHYEVVGTLEELSAFYRVLSARAHVPEDVKTPHKNKTPQKFKLVPTSEMRANLARPLFCASVLWRIARMISKADVQCVGGQRVRI